ncbi:MAG: hypothetical protein ACOYYI_09710 [Chloroflexota bacterium]
MKICVGFLAVVVLFAALFSVLNYRQLHAVWSVRRETRRLLDRVNSLPLDFRNPPALSDVFQDGLSETFWKFVVINGGGRISNDKAFHAAAVTAKQGLTIYHFPDGLFSTESDNIFARPAAGQYNNVSLIGRQAFMPTPSEDVVLAFSVRTSQTFYGTAGVIFQPSETLRQDGMFAGAFDMFGVSIVGQESSIFGHSGPLCYLALDWNPVRVEALGVDSHTWHVYKIVLRWHTSVEWFGSVYVDGAKLCSMSLPPFGPLEVHVWSDNYLVTSTARRWWEIAPAMSLHFQDGGDKQFHLGHIKIYTEAR